MIIIMGDLNSKIGKEKYGVLVGEHSLGVRNERGDRMKLFIEEFIILNTFFKLPPRRLYTQTSPKINLEGLLGTKLTIYSFSKDSVIVV